MQNHSQIDISFNRHVRNKYNVYSGIFLNLPFENITNIGKLIPVMITDFKAGLDKQLDPRQIVENFFEKHTSVRNNDEMLDFMFKVIQYVERQIVLYDSVEDSAFPHLHDNADNMSIKEYIHLCERDNIHSVLTEKLNSFSIRPVFTAHPTQFYPPAVLDIITRLKSMVDKNDINGIDLSMQQLGMTPMRKSKKPTPFEEAQNIIYYLRDVYYDAMGDFYSEIKQNLPSFDNPGIVRIGFWPGGDRDGNPYVTAETTTKVADDLRMSLMKCYYRDIKSLEKKLTFRKVDEIIAGLREKLYKSMFDPSFVLDYNDIIHLLQEVREVVSKAYNNLYLEDIDAFIDKVRIFRTHFATLDIRQDHSIHLKAIISILRHQGVIENDIEELDRNKLMDILIHDDYQIDPAMFEDEVVKETILNIMQLGSIQVKNGELGCNRYIISNSEDIFSILFVFALFRWCGYEIKNLTFDIVPLFETMHGMEEGASVMEEVFQIPEYREHVRQRDNRQTIMLGFSDGTKDGGYLKANWSIFKTKEALSGICKKFDVDVIFFDGRGGPPARGGGKSHRFYAAQSEKIANQEIQLTIQGQTITSRYGTREQFINNCDQLLTAGLSRDLPGKKVNMEESDRKMIEQMSEISYQKYLDLKNHPLFVPYLENKTPLKYYSEANIGSRPAKRGNKKQLEFKDLRAIPFVGSWSQMKQNVPGYYGLGTALDHFARNVSMQKLQQLFNEVLFFKALILNSMMSLSKCNFALTAHIGKDPEYGDFWKLIHDEYQLTHKMVLAISGYDILMQEEPVTHHSVEIREEIVLPLLLLQQYAMQKLEDNPEKKENYEKLITRSLYGIINASRNSI